MRHRVLPVLHTLNPRSVATLSETTERLQAALSVYEVGLAALDAECWLENGGDRAVIALAAVRRRGAAGREWLRERLSQRGFTAEVAVAVLSARSGALFEGRDICAAVHGDRLLLQPAERAPLPAFDARSYSRPKDFVPARAADRITIDADAVVGDLCIRRVAAGDRFAPFGMPKGTKLVSDYLTDRHRSVLEKQAAAVVCDERGIVWLVGETVDRRVAVHRSTQTILDIRLLPPDREA